MKFGGCLFLFPCYVYVDKWWHMRRLSFLAMDLLQYAGSELHTLVKLDNRSKLATALKKLIATFCKNLSSLCSYYRL